MGHEESIFNGLGRITMFAHVAGNAILTKAVVSLSTAIFQLDRQCEMRRSD